MKKIVLVCGSRDYDDHKFIFEQLNILFLKYGIKKIISGGCSGADSLAEKYAKNNNLPITIIKANWKKYGKKAGPMRNKKMIKLKPNIVVAFSSKHYLTPGTKNMVSLAEKKGIKVLEFYKF